MISIFTDKSMQPTEPELEKALGENYKLWHILADFTKKMYPAAIGEWNYPGAKYGWSFRIKDKKRAIIYLLPRDKYFKIALVFGQKATDEILKSNIAEFIKTELLNAKPYAEGRGIRIEVKDNSNLKDLEHLIRIKISN